MHTCTHTHAHAHMHTHTRTHACTHTHTHTNTHTLCQHCAVSPTSAKLISSELLPVSVHHLREYKHFLEYVVRTPLIMCPHSNNIIHSMASMNHRILDVSCKHLVTNSIKIYSLIAGANIFAPNRTHQWTVSEAHTGSGQFFLIVQQEESLVYMSSHEWHQMNVDIMVSLPMHYH